MNGKPIAVERASFSILTFKKNGSLVSPLSDRHDGPALSWRWRLIHPSATRLWPMPALDFWLEGVNGRPRRWFDGGLNRRPWED